MPAPPVPEVWAQPEGPLRVAVAARISAPAGLRVGRQRGQQELAGTRRRQEQAQRPGVCSPVVLQPGAPIWK
jgi:hypothetical protein